MSKLIPVHVMLDIAGGQLDKASELTVRRTHMNFIINFEKHNTILTTGETKSLNVGITFADNMRDTLFDQLGYPYCFQYKTDAIQTKMYKIALFKVFCKTLLTRSDKHLKQLKKKG